MITAHGSSQGIAPKWSQILIRAIAAWRLPCLAMFCLLMILLSPASALDPNKAITQYVQDVWQIEQGLPQNSVQAILQTRDGYLWLGTQEGLVRFDGVRFTIFDKTNTAEIKQNDVRTLLEDREGSLWIGTEGGGLNRLKDGKFTSYTTKDGLFDDVVYVTLEDGRGNLWMSCNKGIFRVSKTELNDFAAGKIKRITPVAYGTADGMKSRECNGGQQPAGWKTRDGRLWFPTIKGVVMIDPENIRINEMLPPVIVEDVIADNAPVWASLALPGSHPPAFGPSTKLELPPGKEKFEFHYSALSLLVPERVLFKYKLEGFDKDWVEAGTRRTAYYTNIPPGNYTFRVQA